MDGCESCVRCVIERSSDPTSVKQACHCLCKDGQSPKVLPLPHKRLL